MSSVVWITGLSGAGKSTLAHGIAEKLRIAGKTVVTLDGDELRKVFEVVEPNEKNHGREARLSLAKSYARLCKMISAQDVVVVIATISMFNEIYTWNRANLPSYFEVYLKIPVEELRRRDPKGIYRRFDAGKLKNVSGIDLSIDEPKGSDWVVEFAPEVSVEELVEELSTRLSKKNVI